MNWQQTLKITLMLNLCLIGASCSYQYTRETVNTSLGEVGLAEKFLVKRQAQWVLHQNSALYLAHPEDVSDNIRVRHLALFHNSMKDAFLQRFPSLTQANESQSLQSAFAYAEINGSELLLWPRLFKVENRLNSRQELVEGKTLHPDKKYGVDQLTAQVLIYEVRTQSLLDTAVINASAALLGANDKQASDLFEKLAQAYADSLVNN